MSPQHSSPPECTFLSGVATEAHKRMKCCKIHVGAVYTIISNALALGFIPILSGIKCRVRYCFHCFERWFRRKAQCLFQLCDSHEGKPALLCCTSHTLHPPGGPPWVNLTNYSIKTKNRPFTNLSSWADPKTWRSLERAQYKEIKICH